jgi:hypothetical protein
MQSCAALREMGSDLYNQIVEILRCVIIYFDIREFPSSIFVKTRIYLTIS